MEEIPGGYLVQPPDQSRANFQVQWGCLAPHPFTCGNPWKRGDSQTFVGLIQHLAALVKNVFSFSQLFDSPGPTRATSLAVYPPPFSQSPGNGCAFLSALCSLPALVLSFWVGVISSGVGNASWFANRFWGFLCRDLRVVNKLMNALNVGQVFLSPKLVGKKANIWGMTITYHPFLVFSSTP